MKSVFIFMVELGKKMSKKRCEVMWQREHLTGSVYVWNMRFTCAAWSNTVNYTPKNPSYVIFRYSEGERKDISWRHGYLRVGPKRRWVKRKIYCEKIEKNVLPSLPYGNAQTLLILFVHCAFGFSAEEMAKLRKLLFPIL